MHTWVEPPVDDVRAQLAARAAAGATGRLTVRGTTGGWIHLHEGRVACAERAGRTTLLVAMAEANLFSADEWQLALRLPYGTKWATLVGGDEARQRELVVFARAFVIDAIAALVDPERVAQATFTPGVAHPFGVLATWPLEEVVPEAPAVRNRAEIVDRAEFLELLEEVSPHVRRRPAPARTSGMVTDGP